ncbi:MAG TPA: NUMOD4 motif-containing HNH endonuclease [Bacteroidales bacterium]|nr:NUMOD4 motif-containing HNH endonuclease [Bacteroidales bacterium]
MIEIWKGIEESDGYEVSNQGRIRKREKIMMQQRQNSGYLLVHLRQCHKRRAFTVHRLVARYFIPNGLHKPCVNHINGNKDCNKAENLEWCTHSENNTHAYRTGLSIHRACNGEKNPNSKLSKIQVDEIRGKYNPPHYNQNRLAEEYNVASQTISSIITNTHWK